jgi:hypothetical protein
VPRIQRVKNLPRDAVMVGGNRERAHVFADLPELIPHNGWTVSFHRSTPTALSHSRVVDSLGSCPRILDT